MKNRMAYLLATALVLVLPVVAGAANMTDKQAAANAAVAAMVPMKSEAEAVATLIGVNDHEIRASALAQTKTLSPAVMDYAKMMVKEHGDNQAKTTSLAKAQALTPTDTAGVRILKAKKQAERDDMSRLDPAKFEAAYIAAMVKDHAEVLTKLDREMIPSAKNAALAQHLRDTRAHVAMHLEQAKGLAGSKNVKLD